MNLKYCEIIFIIILVLFKQVYYQYIFKIEVEITVRFGQKTKK